MGPLRSVRLRIITFRPLVPPGDLDTGLCPEHATKPELVEEENWLFRLSRYEHALRKLYAHREIEIIPETRRSEVGSWIDSGLEDFSVSRCATRARGWGIPVYAI
jgi:methionyl-tRNA synthetase